MKKEKISFPHTCIQRSMTKLVNKEDSSSEVFSQHIIVVDIFWVLCETKKKQEKELSKAIQWLHSHESSLYDQELGYLKFKRHTSSLPRAREDRKAFDCARWIHSQYFASSNWTRETSNQNEKFAAFCSLLEYHKKKLGFLIGKSNTKKAKRMLV